MNQISQHYLKCFVWFGRMHGPFGKQSKWAIKVRIVIILDSPYVYCFSAIFKVAIKRSFGGYDKNNDVSIGIMGLSKNKLTKTFKKSKMATVIFFGEITITRIKMIERI